MGNKVLKGSQITLNENANYILLQAPTGLGNRVILTLPPTDGDANQYLKTDGNGVLDWATASVTGFDTPVSVTGTHTATTNQKLLLCNATSGAFTVTLYSASSNAGRQITVLKTDSSSNAVSVNDGGRTRVLLVQGESISFVSDGTNWFIYQCVPKAAVQFTSSQFTPSGSGSWYQMSNNSTTLTTGRWLIQALAEFSNGGSSPSYANTAVVISAVNGNNTGTYPGVVTAVTNVTAIGNVFAYSDTPQRATSNSDNYSNLITGQTLIEVNGTSGNIFVVPYSELGTPANARITTSFNAIKVGF